MATTTIAHPERLRRARIFALKEAEERFRHELLEDEERLMLHERILRLEEALAGQSLERA